MKNVFKPPTRFCLINGGVLSSHGGTPKSSILDWDFPRKKPSSYGDTPIYGNPQMAKKAMAQDFGQTDFGGP